MQVKIKENSWFAKMAAQKLKGNAAAIVFGKTIHLYNATKEEFLQNEPWVRHEIAHVLQYRQLGFPRFIFEYVIESIRKGYFNNKFEVEAREKEIDATISSDIVFVS